MHDGRSLCDRFSANQGKEPTGEELPCAACLALVEDMAQRARWLIRQNGLPPKPLQRAFDVLKPTRWGHAVKGWREHYARTDVTPYIYRPEYATYTSEQVQGFEPFKES